MKIDATSPASPAVRLHLQRLTDRAFYGGRSDPATTARRVAAHLQQSDELTDVLGRARDALRLPWMVLDRAPNADQADGLRLAEVGARTGAAGPTSAWRPGIGIRSIRDRAEELGGTAIAGPGDDGWVMHARLPLAT